MFCEEKVIKVYLQRFKYDYPNAKCFFDYFDNIAFYTTDEYKIVLETENYMISIGTNGISLCSKTDFKLEYSNSEFLESDIDEEYIGFKTELFTGERLISVEKRGDIFELSFDDFTMKVMPFHYKKLNVKSRDLLEFGRVAGCDRHIQRKCECGGEAEILYRDLPGYVVRCKKCNKSTSGFDSVCEAAECWNSGKISD